MVNFTQRHEINLIIGIFLATCSLTTFGQGYSIMQRDIRSDTLNAIKRFKYIEQIKPDDTLCASAVRKASHDSKDTLHFVVIDWVFGEGLRYEDELKLLVEREGLKFDYLFGTDVFYENQTDGCYKDFMDKRLFEKFGWHFKERLYRQADSLYLINHINDTILDFICDKEPSFEGSTLGQIHVEKRFSKKEKRTLSIPDDREGFAIHEPSVDVGFTIDKNGSVSKFKLFDFVPNNVTEKFKQKFLQLASNEIQTNYSKWEPGEINGVKVKSFHVMRVHFKSID